MLEHEGKPVPGIGFVKVDADGKEVPGVRGYKCGENLRESLEKEALPQLPIHPMQELCIPRERERVRERERERERERFYINMFVWEVS
jgi:hypothetical protein